jgi:hypothetical protein
MQLNTRYSVILLVFYLTGCTGPVIVGTDAAVIVATKGWGDPAADTKDQIPQHQSWCYSTMGDTECYSHPQDVQPHRLVNVDPQSAYPLTPTAYRQVVALDKAPAGSTAVVASDAPVVLTPAPVLGVDQESEKDIRRNSSPN